MVKNITNILSPSLSAGPIESDGILNDVKQNNCTKNKITIMQNIMNIKFSIIARNFFTLFICILKLNQFMISHQSQHTFHTFVICI